MSDQAFYNKVKLLLDKLDLVFHQEWDMTRDRLGKNSASDFIDPEGSFLEPEGDRGMAEWKSRDELLHAYRSTVVALMRVERAKTGSQQLMPPSQSTGGQNLSDSSAPVSVYPAAAKPPGQPVPRDSHHDPSVEELARAAAEDEGADEPQQRDRPSSETEKQKADLPEKGADRSPSASKIPAMRIPKPVTGPQGFPSPFSKPVPIQPASTPAVDKPRESEDPNRPSFGERGGASSEDADVEPEVREKFAHLLEGVKSKRIRDFILAEGTNTKTGKPSMIIHIPKRIWLEFAFDYEEGRRILNKYPQRDRELIEFMAATGHSE